MAEFLDSIDPALESAVADRHCKTSDGASFMNPWRPWTGPEASDHGSNEIRSEPISDGPFGGLPPIIDNTMNQNMNNPEALIVYGELLLFRYTSAAQEMLIHDPSLWKQGALCTAAQRLELEYEYRLSAKQARISRRSDVPVLEHDISIETPDYWVEQDHVEEILNEMANSRQDDLEQLGVPSLESWQNLTFDIYSNSLPAPTYTTNQAASTSSSISEFSNASMDFGLASPRKLPQNSKLYSQNLSKAKGSLMSQFSGSSFGKKHKCPHCDKSYTRPSSLQTHIYSHTGEKPFSCRFMGCGRSFAVASNFRRHEKVHRGETSEIVDSDRHSLSSIGPESGSSSVQSFHSGSGRNKFQGFFSRSSSTGHGTDGGKQDIFGFSSTREVSPSPGRRGPLGETARAALRAVKKIGACWRCKILRKKCDPENPCKGCPKMKGSYWNAIGCRRGELGRETAHIILCPAEHTNLLSTAQIRPTYICDEAIRVPSLLSNDSNTIWAQDKERRDKDVEELVQWAEAHSECRSQITSDGRDMRPIHWEPVGQWTCTVSVVHVLGTCFQPPVIDKPFTTCILAIIWELVEMPIFPTILEKVDFEHVVLLLSSASRYQTAIDGDQLIFTSLMCLRSALENLRAQLSGYLSKDDHGACKNRCYVDCSTDLSSNLKSYLYGFSRVIFRKENLQSDRAWWLSVFYSLCIQSLVRTALISIVTDEGREADALDARAYLHLPLKLFLASSGGYDPIVSDYSQGSLLASETNHFRDAQAVVKQSLWADTGIQSSRDYLCDLFEVNETLNAEEPEFENSTTSLMDPSDVYAESTNTLDLDNVFGPNPQIGSYECFYPGCMAEPFKSPYTLYSHERIHSPD